MEDNLYREHILDHYGHPRNEGTLEDADISYEQSNPLCSDVVRLDIRLKDGRVSEARFRGEGCVISMASASMFTEEIQGKTVEELKALQDEDMFRMLNVTLGPVRAKCGLLPLRVLQAGLVHLEEEFSKQ
jgi:nitrogen fixation NifU-like protein